jgi:hypothetical protein
MGFAATHVMKALRSTIPSSTRTGSTNVPCGLAVPISVALLLFASTAGAERPAQQTSVAPSASLLTPSANSRASNAGNAANQPVSSSAEHADKWRQDTLFGRRGPLDHGGYGSLLLRSGALNGDPALFIGARGGWLLGHQLLIGFAGMGQTLTVDAPSEAALDNPHAQNLEFGYGGLWFAYHVMPELIVHPVASVFIGAGGLTFSDRHFHDDEANQTDYTANGVFVVEPEVDLELNVADFMRLQLTLSYRQVVGVDMPGLKSSDVSGVTGGIAAVFGKL